MTDTSAATATTDQEQVPDIGFSVEELQYLLSVSPGASADISAELLRVGPVPSVDDTITVGGAALLARGQLQLLEGGEFRPVDAALVIAYILTNSTRWTTVTGSTEDSADMGLFIESPEGGLLAQPRTLGTWWFIILDPQAPPAEIVLGTVMGMAHEADITGVIARTQTTDHDRTFTVRHNGAEWGYAYGATGAAEPDVLVEQADQEKLITELAAFIAYFPGME